MDGVSSPPMTAEERYRLLLEVSEAANSQFEIAAVLEAVAEALAPSIAVDAVGVTTIQGDLLSPHAIYIRGVERRQGDSWADVIARWLHTTSEDGQPHGQVPGAQRQAYAALEGAVLKQTFLLSYMDAFRIVGIFFLCCIPLLLVFKRGRGGAAGPVSMH